MSGAGPGRIFVYGATRSSAPRKRDGSKRAFAASSAGARFEARATLPGALHAPFRFPAWTRDGAVRIAGEVWRIDDPALLDRLDSCGGSACRRAVVQSALENGHTVTSWVYRYIADLTGVSLIASDDYLDWVKDRASK